MTAAAQHYQQAIALQEHKRSARQPDSSIAAAIAEDITEQAKAYNNLAYILVQQEQWHEAIQLYQQAIQLQPNAAILYSNLGRALLHNHLDEAITAYRRAIEIKPDLALAHHNLGSALQYHGQHEAALESFQTVLRLDPNHATAHGDSARSWLALGKFEQMLHSMRQATLPYAKMLEAYADGAIRTMQQRDDELVRAKASFGKFLQLLMHPVNSSDLLPELLQQLAQTYWHWANVLMLYGGAEQYRQAEIYYQRALTLQPQELELMLRLMKCLLRQNRLNAAALVGRLALTMQPQLLDGAPQLYRQMGELLEQHQLFKLAIDCYQKSLTLKTSARPLLTSQSDHQPESQIHRYFSDWLPTDLVQNYRSTQNWIAISQFAQAQYIILRDLTNDNVVYNTVNQLNLSSELNAELLAERSIEFQFKPDFETNNTEVNQPNSDCAGLNCSSCLKQIWNWFSPTRLRKGLYSCNRQSDSNLADGDAAEITATIPPPYPLFVAVIPQGRAWIVPQQNTWMVCNAIAVLGDDCILTDLSRAYPGALPGCHNSEQQFHQIFTQAALPPLETIKGNIAVLSNLSGSTYFHWMVDVLPRFELLRQSGIDLTTIDWFLVNSTNHSFQRETLNMLKIPAEKILASDQHPHIQAEQLIAPSFAGHLGWLEPWALQFLRQAFLAPILEQNAANREAFPERLYISRSDANHRCVLNETEVLAELTPLGFRTIALDSLSFQQQVALFAHAKVIVAPHGSGLTNLVFCSPATVVVELMSPHYIRHYYWVISRLLGLKHYFLLGEELPCALIRELMYQNPLVEDIWVDLDILKTMLKTLL